MLARFGARIQIQRAQQQNLNSNHYGILSLNSISPYYHLQLRLRQFHFLSQECEVCMERLSQLDCFRHQKQFIQHCNRMENWQALGKTSLRIPFQQDLIILPEIKLQEISLYFQLLSLLFELMCVDPCTLLYKNPSFGSN